MKEPVTLRRIAAEANVSVATVSRALNKPDTVASPTREKILALVERYRYVPDALATSFSSGKSGLIGLIVPTIGNSIYAAFTVAIQTHLQAEGFKLLIANSNYDARLERDILVKLIEGRVEGVILTGFARDPGLYDLLRHYRIPFVITWAVSPDPAIPSISFDNVSAAESAVETLVAHGHRRIGLICGMTGVNDRALQRHEAYRQVLSRHGIAYEPALVEERQFDFAEGEQALERLLDRARPPTAIFCANDILALGALFAARRRGLRVPEDLSIIGFDDLPISRSVHPSLSTIHVPAPEMGELSARRIVDAIRKDEPVQSMLLETSVVMRDSVAER